MAKNFIQYAGKSLEEFGVLSNGAKTHGAPARDITSVSVPGRNGDLLIDTGAYKNITLEYEVGIRRPVEKHLQDLRNYLLSFGGYQKLEDSYHKDEYRLGVYSGGIDPELSVMNRIGKATLKFNCKPQRFLKSGEIEKEYTSSGSSLYNPTQMTSKPLVRVYGVGELSIGDETIYIKTNSGYTDIDCDLMDVFYGGENRNANVELSSGDFFHLDPGENGIKFSAAITKVIVTPRWWMI